MLDKLIEKYRRQFRVLSQQVVDDLIELKKELELEEKPQETKPVIKEIKQEITKEKDIEELRIEYKDRYNKKAFNGWDRETLLSKLNGG